MAGKARVHELAKELGVTSKDVLAKLKDLGEFVKSASSTVEAPVARRLRDAYPKAGGVAKSGGGGRAGRATDTSAAPSAQAAATPGASAAAAGGPAEQPAAPRQPAHGRAQRRQRRSRP